MSKRTVLTAVAALLLVYCAVETAQALSRMLGITTFSMLVASGMLLFVMALLVRLFVAMRRLKRVFAGQPLDQAPRRVASWNPAAVAPKSWAAPAAFFFGARSYTWEELALSYALLGGVAWSVWFLVSLAH